MERILIFIKHRLRFMWLLIEQANSISFKLLFGKKLRDAADRVIGEISGDSFIYRELDPSDIDSLHGLLASQPEEDLRYFNPHGFDKHSLEGQMKNHAFLMMGAFDGEKLAGYFFLRFFVNRKCFVGRLIDKPYRGKGIGLTMNKIMYETAWRMGFRCLSTTSRNNSLVMRAHARNSNMVVVKELGDGYVLVEFVRKR